LLLLTSCQQETESNPSASAGKATGTPALSTRAATAAPAVTPDVDEDEAADGTSESTRPAAPTTPTGQPTTGPTGTPGTPAANPAGPGALVDVSMPSQVGVLLDELPEAMRERAAETLLEADEDFWVQRAIRQIRLTK